MGTFVTPLLACGLLAAAVSAPAQVPPGATTLTEATQFRNQFTLENWDDGGALTRHVFLNMTEFFHHSLIPRGGPVRPLAQALRPAVARFITTTEAGQKPLQAYVQEPTVDGLLVLHKGKVVFEAYPRMQSTALHLTMSVSKVLAATLIAILEERGLLDAQKPVEAYLPALAGSGWAGVTVRDILDMASGIQCLDSVEGAYSDPAACPYQFEAALGWMPPTKATLDDPVEFIRSLKAQRPPGQAFEYASVNTFVLAWLAEAVTGRRYAELLATEIWQKAGTESGAVIAATRRGVPVAHGGVSATLRDIARCGLLFTPAGRAGRNPLITNRHLEQIQKRGRSEVFRAAPGEAFPHSTGEAPRHNANQWDFVMDDGDFFKSGFGGQGLYVSPSKNLVIAFFGTHDDKGKSNELDRVARQLAKSGLFGR